VNGKLFIVYDSVILNRGALTKELVEVSSYIQEDKKSSDLDVGSETRLSFFQRMTKIEQT